MTEITVTRALSELKTLDARIAKYGHQVPFVFVETGGKINGQAATKDEVGSVTTSKFQAYKDLVSRRSAIKRALVVSNATTQVEVGGEIYTVAEAIEVKNTLPVRENFLSILRSQLQQAVGTVEGENNALQQRIDQQLNQLYGRDRSPSDSERKTVVDPLEKQFRASVFDPCNVGKYFDDEVEKINNFRLEVDVALSEVNAVTKLNIS